MPEPSSESPSGRSAESVESPAASLESTDLDFAQIRARLREMVNTDVLHWHAVYKRNAELSRILFRLCGVVVIVASVSIPVLAAFEFPRKNLVVSGAALLIAVLTGLNSFYRWESRWRNYRQSQFAMDQLLSEWRLALLEAENKRDQPTSVALALEATRRLLADAKAVRDTESADYFDNVAWPHLEPKT